MIGVKNTVVDKLVEAIITAPNRDNLVIATRALDRVLLWYYFVVPQWHIREDRIAWWDKFGRPKIKPAYGIGFSSWWFDSHKASKVNTQQNKSRK